MVSSYVESAVPKPEPQRGEEHQPGEHGQAQEVPNRPFHVPDTSGDGASGSANRRERAGPA